MIRRVISHEWRRKGYSSLLLQLTAVASGEDGVRARIVISGPSPDTTPCLVSISAAPHPSRSSVTSNHGFPFLEDILVDSLIVTSTQTECIVTLRQSHTYLRIDMIGRLHGSLLQLWDREGLNSAALAAEAFDSVRHEVTVTIDPLAPIDAIASQRTSAPSPSSPRDARVREALLDTIRRKRDTCQVLRDEIEALERAQQVEDETLVHRWHEERAELLEELRGPLTTPLVGQVLRT